MDHRKEIVASSPFSSSKFTISLFFEVLTRVALGTLPACRQVCKEWRTLTYESTFTSLHCSRSEAISGYYIQGITGRKHNSTFVSMNPFPSRISTMSLDFLPIQNPIIVASSHQGLLCCVTGCTNPCEYYVCKPTTREWRRIPKPKTRYYTNQIGIVAQSNPVHFIIVRISDPKCSVFRNGAWEYRLRCEIYNSKYNKWKRCKDLPPSLYYINGVAIPSNGALHWLANEYKILAFDLCQQDSKLIAVPEEIAAAESVIHLVQFEGHLAVLSKTKEWVDIWVLQHYDQQAWDKRNRVDLTGLVNESFMDLYTSDTLFTRDVNKVDWYNYKNHTRIENHILDHMYVPKAFPFYSDLEYCFLSESG